MIIAFRAVINPGLWLIRMILTSRAVINPGLGLIRIF